MKEYRSEAYREWQRSLMEPCQCGCRGLGEDFAHGPRRRPWIAEVEPGRFSPSKAKSSDYGGLMLTHACHMKEGVGRLAMHPMIVQGLLRRELKSAIMMHRFAEHLDPGSNLWAEALEFMQRRLNDMEVANDQE